ncbi:hypothetical protein KBB08_00475 [Candidatus Gracilibacteria bacterium]|nr:hypothetical protein [Candidatus Gracilibacteria bacterium]
MLLLLPSFLAVLTSAVVYFFRKQSTLWLVLVSLLQVGALVISWSVLTNLQVFASIVLIVALAVLQIVFAQSSSASALGIVAVSLWLFFLQAVFSTTLIWWWVLVMLVWFAVLACRYCLQEVPTAYIFVITAGLTMLKLVSLQVLSSLAAVLLAGFIAYLVVVFVLATAWWWRQVAWGLLQILWVLLLLTVLSSSSQVAALFFLATAIITVSLGTLLGDFFDSNQQVSSGDILPSRVVKTFWMVHLFSIWSLPPVLSAMSFFLVLTQLLQFGLAWTIVFVLSSLVITFLLTTKLLPEWQTKIQIKPRPHLYFGAGILVIAILILPLSLPDPVITFLQSVLVP